MNSEELKYREQICSMCREMYTLGWVSGTGGGISIRADDKIYMAPSGVQKEKIRPEEIFILDATTGEVLKQPAGTGLKLTECAPLFQAAYDLRHAGAVIHSHSVNVVLATMLAERIEPGLSSLSFTELEMIKGLEGHGYYDTFVLPVVDNTARECDLTASLRNAIERFDRTCAVAVHNHGIYVWGPTAEKAKTQAECLDYLCEVTFKMKSAGIDHRAVAVADARA